jgi:hypothetical protein
MKRHFDADLDDLRARLLRMGGREGGRERGAILTGGGEVMRFAFLLALLLSSTASATITTSEIVEDRAQRDGRRYITERHVDSSGAVWRITCLAPAAANASTIMAARVTQLEADAKAGEVATNLANALSDQTPAPTFVFSTQAELAAAVRAAFKTARGRDAVRLGWYVESFNMTNNQLANLFGITALQAATLQVRLDDLAAKYNGMQQEAGE